MESPHMHYFSNFRYHIVLVSKFIMAGLLLFALAIIIPLSSQQTNQQNYASPLANPVLLKTLPKSEFRHPLHIKRMGIASVSPALGSGYEPSQIQAAYHLPSTGGSGTIVIVDAYNAPNIENDLSAFDNKFNIVPCTKANGCLTVHFQGSSPPPAPPPLSNWDVEITIDVEWAHAIAPNAKILLYEANSSKPVDLLTGVDFGRNQSSTRSISMSWVTDEFSNESSFDTLFTASHPVAFFAASGDNGSHNSWPAVSSNVIAVGGTSLILNSDNSVQSETAWSGSGGGDSSFEAEPSYQSSYNIPQAKGMRGTPDVSLDADPEQSPYLVIFNGSLGAVGGTSVGTPIWAAMNTLNTKTITNDLLYSNAKTQMSSYYRDITVGTNGTCSFYCSAQVGYDYVTGLGTPILLPQLPAQPSPTSPQATSTSTPTPTGAISVSPPPTGIPPGHTGFQISLCPHGLGNCGDNVSAQSGGNINPIHTSRTTEVSVYDGNGTLVTQNTSVPVVYSQTTQTFTGLADMGTLVSGSYLVRMKLPGFLSAKVPGITTVTLGGITSLATLSLVTGDVNNDDQLDIQDYNNIISCFGSKVTSPSCTIPPTSQSSGADINDDGKVDGIDYNLLLREFSVQKGG